jgi:hypothetical protein
MCGMCVEYFQVFQKEMNAKSIKPYNEEEDLILIIKQADKVSQT